VEAALSHFDPDVLVDASKGRPDAPVGKGREHMNAVVTGWVASWEEWREEIEEMRDLGSRVLVLSVQRGRGKGSGVEVEARYAILYEVHGGKITSVRMYWNPTTALEAAGLSE
jgi:ketosteroid isomerase-like protein